MTPLRVGDDLPAFDLVDHDGTAWPLRDHVGRRPLVLILHRHLA